MVTDFWFKEPECGEPDNRPVSTQPHGYLAILVLNHTST